MFWMGQNRIALGATYHNILSAAYRYRYKLVTSFLSTQLMAVPDHRQEVKAVLIDFECIF
ncbi:hypothetical protein Plhal304r1_c035g0109591 [Plasmopara halstedii]